MIKIDYFGKILQKLPESLTAIIGILNVIILEKRRIMGILEPITAFTQTCKGIFGIYRPFISFLQVK